MLNIIISLLVVNFLQMGFLQNYLKCMRYNCQRIYNHYRRNLCKDMSYYLKDSDYIYYVIFGSLRTKLTEINDEYISG